LLHLLTALPCVFLGFHTVPLSPTLFPLFYHLPPWCKKMKRTRDAGSVSFAKG
jgi:hypothetical protein